MTAEEIIQKAKQTYPCNYEYKGNLEEKKIEKIKEVCNVNTFSVSMLGNNVYHIKYRKEKVDETRNNRDKKQHK